MDKTFAHNLVVGSSSKNSLEHFNDEKIIKVHNSSNDNYFTIVSTNEIGSFNFYYINTSRVDADISSLDLFFASGFHNKKINSLSCSVTKQILGSCSEDNTVKLWNFF
jgi:WD40 repeat protein